MAQWHESGRVVGLVARKWVIRLMHALEEGPLRHNELKRSVPGIGSTALDSTLRSLQSAGLVERRVDDGETPPAVSYAVTDPARDLFTALEGLADWGRLHMPSRPGMPGEG